MSAQEREALARELSKSRAPDWWDGMRAATFEDLDGVDRPYSVPDDEDYATADVLLAAGWTRPDLLPTSKPGGDAIERVRELLSEDAAFDPGGLVGAVTFDDLARRIVAALASPVLEPGAGTSSEPQGTSKFDVRQLDQGDEMTDPLNLDEVRALADVLVTQPDDKDQDDGAIILALLDRLEAAEADRDRLTGWKESAMSVFGQWEAVHVALGRPGRLGESKSKGVLDHVTELQAKVARVEALVVGWETALGLNSCPSCGFAPEADCDHGEGYHHALSDLRAALKGDS